MSENLLKKYEEQIDNKTLPGSEVNEEVHILTNVEIGEEDIKEYIIFGNNIKKYIGSIEKLEVILSETMCREAFYENSSESTFMSFSYNDVSYVFSIGVLGNNIYLYDKKNIIDKEKHPNLYNVSKFMHEINKNFYF